MQLHRNPNNLRRLSWLTSLMILLTGVITGVSRACPDGRDCPPSMMMKELPSHCEMATAQVSPPIHKSCCPEMAAAALRLQAPQSGERLSDHNGTTCIYKLHTAPYAVQADSATPVPDLTAALPSISLELYLQTVTAIHLFVYHAPAPRSGGTSGLTARAPPFSL